MTPPPADEAGSGPEPLRRRLAERWAAGASAALFAALAWPALRGLVYSGDDLLKFHLPLRAFYARRLADGGAFDWFPAMFSGFYLTGEGQAGTWHPLHWALYRFLDLGTAFDLEIVLSYPFAFVGMLLLLRRPGLYGERLPPFAAIFGAMLFAFCGFCLLHVMHPNAVAVVAHYPWLLWCIDLAVRDDRRRPREAALGAIALLTASQLLLGYPQYVWIGAFAEVFWMGLALFALPRRRKDGLATMGRLAAAKALGAALGAIQLLPTWEHLHGSVRGSWGTDLANLGSLHPLNVSQLLAPYALDGRVVGGNTQEFSVYAGAVPTLLVAWLLTGPGRGRTAVRAVAVFALIAFLLAMGNHAGLYRLQTLLPVVGNAFRLPARFVVLVQLAVALLAAFAIAEVAASAARGARSWAGGWILVAASVAVTLGLRAIAPPQALASEGLAIVGPLLFVAAAAALALSLRDAAAGLPMLVLLAAADAGTYGMSVTVWPQARSLHDILADLAPPPAPGARLATMQPDASGHFLGNQSTLAGWVLADGYAGLLPRSALPLDSAAARRLASVEFVGGENLERVADPFPRVRLATRALVSTDPARDAAAIATADLAVTALVERAVNLAGPVGEIRVTIDEPGRIQVQTSLPQPQLVVVTERWHPGWKAAIDGRSAEVRRVNGDFLGVAVGAGTSQVELRFSPDSLRNGRMVSGAALAAWVLLAIAAWRRQDTAEADPARPARPPG